MLLRTVARRLLCPQAVTAEQVLQHFEQRANLYEEDAGRIRRGREPIGDGVTGTADTWYSIARAIKDIVAELRKPKDDDPR